MELVMKANANPNDPSLRESTVPEGCVAITQKEYAAVNRLKSLGFGFKVALRAFIKCHKSEERAANYLFENPENENQ